MTGTIVILVIIAGVCCWLYTKRAKDIELLREQALKFTVQFNAFILSSGYHPENRSLTYLKPFIMLDDKAKRIVCCDGKERAAIMPYSKLIGYRLCESGHVRTEDDGFESAAAGAIIGNMIDKKYTSAGAIIGAAGKRTSHIPVSDGIELLLQTEDVACPLITLSYVNPDTDKNTEEYKDGLTKARYDEALLAIVMRHNRINTAEDGEILHWQFKPDENFASVAWKNESEENIARREFGLPYDASKINPEDEE